MHKIASKLRARRNTRQFVRAMETASPAMQQELLAASLRSNYSTF